MYVYIYAETWHTLHSEQEQFHERYQIIILGILQNN